MAYNPGSETVVRPVDAEADATDLSAIYNHYILNTVATFEEVAIDTEEMQRRIDKVLALNMPWLVALYNGEIAGYAYVSPFKERSAYRFSLESTVYIAKAFVGCGVGNALYSSLLASIDERGFHTTLGVISLPNVASIALHEKFGFVKVAHLKEVGFKYGEWIDVGYWQRSKIK